MQDPVLIQIHSGGVAQPLIIKTTTDKVSCRRRPHYHGTIMRLITTCATLSILTIMLSSCAHPAQSISWQLEVGKPTIPEGKEKIRCILHAASSNGTYIELGNHFGNFMLLTSRKGTMFGEFLPATTTLSSRSASLTMSARPINGGILVTPLSDVSDPNHMLVAIISSPFRLSGQVAGDPVIDQEFPAVPDFLRKEQAACLILDQRIENGTAVISRDGVGNPVYSTRIN
jgi:hypothetical protein